MSEQLAQGTALVMVVPNVLVGVWQYYRFGGMEGDCIVFQVSISNVTGVVSDAGQNTDPACDHGGDKSG